MGCYTVGMRVFFSGIGGVGIGPLAQISRKAGYSIAGSDLTASLTTEKLMEAGVTVAIGEQTDEFLRREHAREPFDYFVYTAALPADHPELVKAHDLGIMRLKRDGLLARIIDEKQLQMIAIAGTHGKTTTTGLMVWAMRQLGLPISYSVGTTLSFGPSGDYDPDSQYFVYECDEYDRNMLHFTPELTVLTSLDYDHPDSYPTIESYQQAFRAFIEQSGATLLWQKDYRSLGQPELDSDHQIFDETIPLDHLRLAGLHMRQNAFLVERAILRLFPDTPYHDLVSAISSFPGTDRRMQKLADHLYSDYGHHPAEIAATLQLARELAQQVVLVYQPHQNVRQHEIRHEYTDSMLGADEIYWLPTYLSREDPALPVLTPEELSSELRNHDKVHIAELGDELWQAIKTARTEGKLVLAMGAGSIDGWLRERLTK